MLSIVLSFSYFISSSIILSFCFVSFRFSLFSSLNFYRVLDLKRRCLIGAFHAITNNAIVALFIFVECFHSNKFKTCPLYLIPRFVHDVNIVILPIHVFCVLFFVGNLRLHGQQITGTFQGMYSFITMTPLQETKSQSFRRANFKMKLYFFCCSKKYIFQFAYAIIKYVIYFILSNLIKTFYQYIRQKCMKLFALISLTHQKYLPI